MPIDLVLLRDYHALRRKAELEGNTAVLPANPQAVVEDFATRCSEFGVTVYWEWDKGDKLEEVLEGLRQKFGPAAPPPDFCKDLPKNSWYEVQNFEFSLYKLGEWAFSVEDEKASNKRAAKMPGDHFEWATSYTFDNSLLDLVLAGEGTEQPEYRLNVAVRCDAKDGIEGNAMTLGVYDPENKKEVLSKTLSVAEIRGTEYHWIDMGTAPLHPTLLFWFAPPKRPGEVDAVYIDRIVVIRER
jgi:hypothetical protein